MLNHAGEAGDVRQRLTILATSPTAAIWRRVCVSGVKSTVGCGGHAKEGAGILRIAECGKLSRGNLWKIKCRTFCKLPIIALPHSAAEKFRISTDH